MVYYQHELRKVCAETNLLPEEDRSLKEEPMFCPQCGTKNADEAKFCEKCGSQMPSTADKESNNNKPVKQVGGLPKSQQPANLSASQVLGSIFLAIVFIVGGYLYLKGKSTVPTVEVKCSSPSIYPDGISLSDWSLDGGVTLKGIIEYKKPVFSSIEFTYKLYDSSGTVVDSGLLRHPEMKVGEKGKIELTSLEISKAARVEITIASVSD